MRNSRLKSVLTVPSVRRMKYLVVVFLALQVCYTGVNGANVAVNQNCASGDTCDPAASNTCDSHADGGAKCKTMVAQNCVKVGDCIKNAECPSDNAACACKDGYTPASSNTVCEIPAGKVNGACKGTDPKCDDAINTCDANIGQTCKTKAGQNCVGVGNCIKNAACSDAGKPCLCGDNFVPSSDNTTCLIKIGQACSGGGCILQSNCNAQSRCECAAGLIASVDNDICIKGVGEACTGDQCGPGATCNSGNKCECKDGYEESEKRCKKSGAASLTSSFLLLATVVVTSRLL